uniref:Uncharacterized protein n=1 Tax=Parascaris equorum TaxID=6256 RepID=A0A914RXT5_PAREQ
MADSQWMFEQLFQLSEQECIYRFTKDLSNWTKSKSNDTEITQEQLELIKRKNNLDIQLYAYAQKLFLKRFVSNFCFFVASIVIRSKRIYFYLYFD